MNDVWIHTKTQDLRVVDVFALGPFMVWFGVAARGVPEWARLAMVVSGIATITYNGANWLAYRDYLERTQSAAPETPPA